MITYLPFIIAILFGFFLGLQFTRSAAIWLLAENHPVELLTLASLLLGEVQGLQLVWQTS